MSSSIKSELHRGLFFAAVLSIVWQSADAVSEDVAHPAVETKADLGSRTGESKPFREELPQIDPPGLTAPVNPKAGEPLAEGGIEIEKLQHSNQPVQSLLAKIYGEHVQHEIEILRVACQPTARQLEQLQAAGERHVLQFINSRIASRKLRFLGTIVSLAEETPEKRLSQRIRKEAKTVLGPIAMARLQREQALLQAQRSQAIILNLIARLDSELLLTPAQRKQLLESFGKIEAIENLSLATFRYENSEEDLTDNFEEPLPVQIERELLPHLTEAQQEVWQKLPKDGTSLIGLEANREHELQSFRINEVE